MRHLRFAAAAAILIGGFDESARPQSFDCQAARSPLEKRVCDEPSLSALDYELARVFRMALKGAGADHDALLAQQRAWLSLRDSRCHEPPKANSEKPDAFVAGTHRSRLLDLEKRVTEKPDVCIAQAYHARLFELEKRVTVDDAARRAPCEELAKAYSGQVATDPKSARVAPSSLIHNAANVDSGVGWDGVARLLSERFPKLRAISAKSPLHGWDEMAQFTTDTIELSHLPNTNVYALSSVAGELYCYQFEYVFGIREDRVYYIPAPEGWERAESDACMISRSFGTLLGNPVASEVSDSRGGLRETVRLSAWAHDHFIRACRVDFAFAPSFSLSAPDLGESRFEKTTDCLDARCRNVQNKVAALVGQVQKSPVAAMAEAMASLNESQRKDFILWRERRDANPSTSNDPMSFDEKDPLYAPLQADGRLFFVEISHVFARDVMLPNWDVSVEPDGGGEGYAFFIRMDRGRFLSAKVE